MASSAPTQTVESKTAVDYLDPTSEPQPAEVTGVNTHFTNTFAKSQKANDPTAKPEVKLENTSSNMTTAQLQQAAADAQSTDPNLLKHKGQK